MFLKITEDAIIIERYKVAK